MHKTLKEIFYINKLGGYEALLNNKNCRELFQISDYKTRALRGISFMEEIPSNRTCADAMISNTHCVCNKKINITIEQYSNETNATSNNVIEFITQHLNDKSNSSSICERFMFESFIGINKVFGSLVYYEFVVRYQPGDSIYQINLVYKNNSFNIVDKMVRISRYSNQSYCVRERNMLGFCFCYKSIQITEKEFLEEIKLEVKEVNKRLIEHIDKIIKN